MTKQPSRSEHAAEVASAVEAILDHTSKIATGGLGSRYHCSDARSGMLHISRTPPMVSIDGALTYPAIFSIWTPDKKVFSAHLSAPIYICGFHKGPWIEELFAWARTQANWKGSITLPPRPRLHIIAGSASDSRSPR